METHDVTFTVSFKGGAHFNIRSVTTSDLMKSRTKEVSVSTEKACFKKIKKQTQQKNLSKQRCKSEAKHISRSEYGMILTMVTGTL